VALTPENLTTKKQRHEENFALQSLRIIVRREDFSSSPTTHELGSPGTMQTFASGEAKVRHPFGNFKPQTRLPDPLPCGVKQRECLVAAKPRCVFVVRKLLWLQSDRKAR
jgi:hypothetical protein